MLESPILAIELVRTHQDAVVPAQSRPGDVGYDLCSVQEGRIYPGESVAVDTGWILADVRLSQALSSLGLSVELKIEQRSGLALEGIFPIGGVVDPTYRGPLRVVLHNGRRTDTTRHMGAYDVRVGDRIAQLVIYPVVAGNVSFHEGLTVSETERGSRGFGSTGR